MVIREMGCWGSVNFKRWRKQIRKRKKFGDKHEFPQNMVEGKEKRGREEGLILI